MNKLRYVVTSGKHVNMVLYKQDYFKMKNALGRARQLKSMGKKDVAIKSYRKGEGISHIKYL